MFYTAVESGGGMALFEAYQDAESKKLYPLRDWKPMMAAFPFLIERFSSHQEYGSSSLAEMFREKLKSFGELRLNMLETTLFLNRGDHFESLPLPAEAQFAPAFWARISLGSNFQYRARMRDAACGCAAMARGDSPPFRGRSPGFLSMASSAGPLSAIMMGMVGLISRWPRTRPGPGCCTIAWQNPA